MGRRVCRHERLGFDAPRCVNTAAKTGVEDLRVNRKILTLESSVTT